MDTLRILNLILLLKCILPPLDVLVLLVKMHQTYNVRLFKSINGVFKLVIGLKKYTFQAF